MNQKKKSTEAANPGANQQLNNFLNSFHSNRTDFKVQCLNCDAWSFASRTAPTAVYDKSTNKMYLFRICRNCRRSFLDVGNQLKKDFCETWLKKAQKAEVSGK